MLIMITIRMGKCILLENDMFHTGLGLSKRKGSSVDRALIIDAFHRLGFQVLFLTIFNFVLDVDAVTEADADGVCLWRYWSPADDAETNADVDLSADETGSR